MLIQTHLLALFEGGDAIVRKRDIDEKDVLSEAVLLLVLEVFIVQVAPDIASEIIAAVSRFRLLQRGSCPSGVVFLLGEAFRVSHEVSDLRVSHETGNTLDNIQHDEFSPRFFASVQAWHTAWFFGRIVVIVFEGTPV